MNTINQWLQNEGYPDYMPMTRDNLANIIDRYISTLSTHTHGRTAEEQAEMDKQFTQLSFENIKMSRTLCEISGYGLDSSVDKLCKESIKAMHDFRNQPQQVREEIECTHPYKECVMSDRVNKNGTPLTRCSVCGNDNICDEELMDELVNTFTKEDLRTAFNGAEYFVDFDKWFDTLSTPIK